MTARTAADAIARSCELGRQVTAHVVLELGISLKAQLGGKPHNRGSAGTYRFGKVGDGPKSEQSGLSDDCLGYAALGWREAITGGCDQLGERLW